MARQRPLLANNILELIGATPLVRLNRRAICWAALPLEGQLGKEKRIVALPAIPLSHEVHREADLFGQGTEG